MKVKMEVMQVLMMIMMMEEEMIRLMKMKVLIWWRMIH